MAPAPRKHWAWRLIRIVLIAEIAYLILLNLALQAPATQTLINSFKPEKFYVSWDRAWTWYPFRVHARGVFANGQSRSQQWQLETPAVTASITITPLIFKRVWIRNVVAQDISYKQRPRLKPDKDYSAQIPFYPEIRGRDIVPAGTPPARKKRPWRLAINNISASGTHHYWIMQFNGGLQGELGADLTFETGGGPFSLTGGDLDLALDTLYINNTREVFSQGLMKGTIAFDPFVPKENKGVNLLKFLSTDIDISMDVNSLAFINLFTRNFNQMKTDGVGRVDGHLRLGQGEILDGTELTVDAEDLRVDILGHLIEGEGTVILETGDSEDGQVKSGHAIH